MLAAAIEPNEILWESETGLFRQDENLVSEMSQPATVNLPKEFFDIAEFAACFDSTERWDLLYRVAYRLTREKRSLLKIESDPDIRHMMLMAKGVRRDIHKFHAFVRFRKINIDDSEAFIAWHEPRHHTVELALPFFVRRFGSMRFSILTPKGCGHWDCENLRFSTAVDRSKVPASDETEDFWLAYYRAIFNPFRLKVAAMKRELPVHHWRTLPEAALITTLIRESGERRPRKND